MEADDPIVPIHKGAVRAVPQPDWAAISQFILLERARAAAISRRWSSWIFSSPSSAPASLRCGRNCLKGKSCMDVRFSPQEGAFRKEVRSIFGARLPSHCSEKGCLGERHSATNWIPARGSPR